MKQLGEKEIATIYRQMGDPSWYILLSLDSVTGKPGVQIIRDVEADLKRANHPSTRLDPSTLARALIRMERLKLIRRLPDEAVEVPVGHGVSRIEMRPAWVITAEGETMRERWRASVLEIARQKSASIKLTPVRLAIGSRNA